MNSNTSIHGHLKFNNGYDLTDQQRSDLNSVLDDLYHQYVPTTLDSIPPQWSRTSDGLALMLQSEVRLNEYVKWLKILIKKFFDPWRIDLTGQIVIIKNNNIAKWSNFDFIRVINNKVTSSVDIQQPLNTSQYNEMKIKNDNLKTQNNKKSSCLL